LSCVDALVRFWFFFAGRIVSFDLGKVCQWLGCVFKAQWGKHRPGVVVGGGGGGGGQVVVGKGEWEWDGF